MTQIELNQLERDVEDARERLSGDFEGVFLACSFWLADNYILQGRHDDARSLFERLLSLRNDVGLLSEEYDTKARRMVGNFPQAFLHGALANTAHNLTRPRGPAKHRAESEETVGSQQRARHVWRLGKAETRTSHACAPATERKIWPSGTSPSTSAPRQRQAVNQNSPQTRRMEYKLPPFALQHR